MQISNNKLLVIFAVRGTLLERIRNDRIPLPLTSVTPSFEHRMHHVWLRPYALDCLMGLQSMGCHLGAWSSAAEKNTRPLLEAAFPGVKFHVVLSRDHTRHDEIRQRFNREKGAKEVEYAGDPFATVKDLDIVWNSEGLRSSERYHPGRTVLVEDTPSKARRNADNLLWVKPYGMDEGCTMLPEDKALQDLVRYVEKELLSSKDVRDVLPKAL